MKSLLSATFLMAVGTHTASAATVTWTGAGADNLFTNGDNWSGGTPAGSPPRNNDFQDDPRFGPGGTPVSVSLTTAYSFNNLSFQSAGWTITGSTINNVKAISSSGSGINYISTTVNLQSARTWTVGSGNTLRVSNLYLRNHNLALTGGGILELNGSLTGFGNGNTYGINIGAATLQVDTANLFNGASNTAFVSLANDAAVFDLFGSTANAQNFIDNNRITNTSGDGSFLVADNGNGYARISIVPEPSGFALLSFSALGLLLRRRR